MDESNMNNLTKRIKKEESRLTRVTIQREEIERTEERIKKKLAALRKERDRAACLLMGSNIMTELARRGVDPDTLTPDILTKLVLRVTELSMIDELNKSSIDEVSSINNEGKIARDNLS